MPKGGAKAKGAIGEVELGNGPGPTEFEDVAGADDHVTAFEKQIERLQAIAEGAEFESGSLVGDIRDFLIEFCKMRPKPWSQMSEQEQRDFAKSAENSAKIVIRKLVVVIAEQDEISVQATLKGYSVKGGTFKLNAEARGDDETALQLFGMDGHEVVIMSADAARFTGQKKDAEVRPDQPTLALADAPTPGAENDKARAGVENELDAVDEADELAAGEAAREDAESLT